MTSKHRALFLIIIIFSLMAVGCRAENTVPAAPEAAALTPTQTESPIITSTPTYTKTPTNTPTPTIVPTKVIDVGELVEIPEGGYAFRIPQAVGGEAYIYEQDQLDTILSSPDGAVRVLILIDQVQPSQDLAVLFDEMINSMSDVDLIGDEVEFTLDGYAGLRILYQQHYEGGLVIGEMMMIDLDAGRVLVIYSGVLDDDPQERWRVEGQPLIDALVDSIVISDPSVAESDASCEVSVDDSYGYSPENPIKVGGEFFEGASRERAYLDTLRGPNGEILSYTRLGSEMAGDVILDVYQIEYAGLETPIKLYLDIYHWEPPVAPVGFTCESQFNLGAP